MPPSPAVAKAPVISSVHFETPVDDPDLAMMRLEVKDPNDNLSHQVLGINKVTQESFTFKPPKFVFP